jgi:hypothetical protein
MSASLTALGGRIKQDSTELTPVDGDTKSAKDALGRLIDQIRLDQNYELKNHPYRSFGGRYRNNPRTDSNRGSRIEKPRHQSDNDYRTQVR